MKKLLLGLVALAVLMGGAFSVALAQTVFPARPAGYVSDTAEMLSPEVEASLEAQLVLFEKETGAELAVVTLPNLGGDAIENVAVQLFEQWGIGKEKEDNGVLFLVARDDKKVKIEVGYGLEGVLTDGTSGAILDSVVVPSFRAGDFEKGIVSGADEIIRVFRGGASPVLGTPDDVPDGVKAQGWSLLFVVFLNTAFALLGYMARTKSFWLGGILGAFIGVVFGYFFGFYIPFVAGYAFVGLFLDFILSRYASHWGNGRGGGPGSFWTGGLGGGGSSGGFGGFGGGSSGGGGSSRGW